MQGTTPISSTKNSSLPPLATPSSPATIECRDPATLELLGTRPALSRAEVQERVRPRPRAAQVAWGKTSWKQRRAVFRALQAEILANQDQICRLASRDSGKTMVDAAMGEIFPVCEKIRYLIANGEADLKSESRSTGILMHKRARVDYVPLGVIGVIAPWNFPFHNIFCPLAPALFAGNAVVVKISEYASSSVDEYQAICDRVLTRFGFSTDLVQLITGYGETGSALVTSGVDKIFFTGSPQNGKRVMASGSETLTPVVLELGGKDPMIICDDADLEQAVGAAMLGVFTACGQMCVAAERLYVMDGIYDRFVTRVVEEARALRQGPPLLGEIVDVGATTMPRQLEIIERQVNDAVAKGARVLAGGKRNPNLRGQFWEPTVLVDCTHEMAVVREETFGPVMTIIRVPNDEAEAIRLANDSDYGLGSSVFTKDAKRAERIAQKLSAGMTVVNDYGIAYMVQAAPFGGLKISGFGKINGREGLRACTNAKTTVLDRLPIHASMSMYPVRAATYPLLSGAATMLYGQGLKTRLAGLTQVVKSLRELVSAE